MTLILQKFLYTPDIGVNPSSFNGFGLGYGHQRGADDTVVQQIAFLQYLNYGVGLGIRFDGADGLVLMRIELLTHGTDLPQTELVEDRLQLPKGQFDAAAEAF